MNSAIVTGAHGFIGTHLSTALEARGVTVFRLGRQDSVYDVKDEVDAIFHAADINPEQDNRGDAFMQLLDMNRRILHYWKNAQRDAVLIGFNSMWAYPKEISYGDHWNYWKGPMSDWQQHYGIMKKMMLVGIQSFKHQYQMKGSMLTLGNVYGPGDKSNRTVPKLIRDILAYDGKPIEIHNPSNKRSFTYIEDAVAGILRAVEWEYDLLNVATEPHAIRDVADALFQIMNFPNDVIYTSDGNHGMHKIVVSPDGLWRGIKTHTLEEGLRKTLGMMND